MHPSLSPLPTDPTSLPIALCALCPNTWSEISRIVSRKPGFLTSMCCLLYAFTSLTNALSSLLRHRNFRIFVFNNVRVILSSTVKIYSLKSLENIRFVPSRSISHVGRFDRDFRTRDNSVDRFLFIYPSFLELESKRKVLLDHRASSLSFSRNCQHPRKRA